MDKNPRGRLLTSEEVAERFGVSTKSVVAWARDRKIAYIRNPGEKGAYRFYEADVEALLTPVEPSTTADDSAVTA
jgi:excisionase family DNA binding protein